MFALATTFSFAGCSVLAFQKHQNSVWDARRRGDYRPYRRTFEEFVAQEERETELIVSAFGLAMCTGVFFESCLLVSDEIRTGSVSRGQKGRVAQTVKFVSGMGVVAFAGYFLGGVLGGISAG